MRSWFVIVAIFLPAFASVVMRLLWWSPNEIVATHWGANGVANGFSHTNPVWWSFFVAAIVAGLLGCVVLIIGERILALHRAIALGILAGIAAATPFWAHELITTGAESAYVGSMLPFAAGIAWAILVFLIANPLTGEGSVLPQRKSS